MERIDETTTLQELAAITSQALEDAGITATLSGGAAVSWYSDNQYQSYDLDFITNARIDLLKAVLAPLGFEHKLGARQFVHPRTKYYIEFPPGPIAFGETWVRDDEAAILNTTVGSLRIVTPTQSVMDRLAAYVHWNDRQALDQAAMVASRHEIDWDAVTLWASREGADPGLVDRLKARAEGR